MKNDDKNAATKPEVETKTLEVVLSTGVKAVISEGQGTHVMEAQKMITGGQEQMIPALISVLTTFDGNHKPLEEILKFKIADFMMLVNKFQEINPLSPSIKSLS